MLNMRKIFVENKKSERWNGYSGFVSIKSVKIDDIFSQIINPCPRQRRWPDLPHFLLSKHVVAFFSYWRHFLKLFSLIKVSTCFLQVAFGLLLFQLLQNLLLLSGCHPRVFEKRVQSVHTYHGPVSTVTILSISFIPHMTLIIALSVLDSATFLSKSCFASVQYC